MAKKYTKEDEQYIRDNYKKVDLKTLAARLGHSEKSIRVKASELGVAPRRAVWSEHELKFIAENISLLTADEIANKLYRPVGSVVHAISDLSNNPELLNKIKKGSPITTNNMKGNINQAQLQEIREYIGSWLCAAREQKGLSQQELADKMWIRQETVSKVEAGKWAISVDMLALFCHHLKIPLKKLLK